MAKTNYAFEKRQRELAKKKKQEEKRQRKATRTDDGTVTPPAEDGSTPAPGQTPEKSA